jgi:hypothetical protein
MLFGLDGVTVDSFSDERFTRFLLPSEQRVSSMKKLWVEYPILLRHSRRSLGKT